MILQSKTIILYSTGLKDKSLHVRWFFKIIRDGIRSKNDWQVLKSLDLFNIFIILFKCTNTKFRVIFKKYFIIFLCWCS